MYYLLSALIAAVVGAIPLVFIKKPIAAALQGVLTFFLGWAIFYLAVATTVYPLFGLVGFMTMIWWVVAAIIAVADDDGTPLLWVFPASAVVIYVAIAFFNSTMLRANTYASIINHLGDIEERTWTEDVQPKDPAHMRMASKENASYQAQKVLGTAGAIGSQFELGKMTVQMIKGELTFVAPLDFAGFSIWMNTSGAPGYVKVSGEDPHRQAELVQFPEGKGMRYTPGAFFGDNLERYLRNNGYLGTGLTETSLEIDDEGNPWWVITAFKPTLGWSGEKVLGVVIVNPFSGNHIFHELGKVPEWVDRVIPDDFIVNYLDWQGSYSNGWLNSWWGKKGITTPDGNWALLIYGNNDQPEWVIDITSTNSSDDSLVALVYTNSRTGKTTRYQMPGGGTTSAVLDAVNKNQDIQFKHLHGAAVQLYNVNGLPTAVVPLLNESHAFQGVAMVSINDIQAVASGRSAQESVRNYEKLLTETGRRATVEGSRDIQVIEGTVSLVGSEVTPTQGTVYYLYLKDIPHLFTAGAGHSPELPVTRDGHLVRIEIYASDQDVIPMHSFNNLTISLSESQTQAEARAIDDKARSNREAAEDARTITERIKNLTPEELREIEKKIPKK
ncbi:MAG: hypothetical protein Q8Q06_02915 [bacterium]|nr:hypothetical protein [bacterium]